MLHQHRIIHCDIKPENFILFPGPIVRLADFGIARLAIRTLQASGSGTLGYMAPEQAMGKPSFRSDVFAMGLLLYRMLTGHASRVSVQVAAAARTPDCAARRIPRSSP